MLYAFCAGAQDAIKLNLELKSGDKKAFKNIVYKPVLSDSIELSKELNQIIIQLNKQSYLAANGDLLQLQSDSFLFQINIGNSFEALFVKSDNTSDWFSDKVGFEQINNKKFNYYDWVLKQEQLLTLLEENGFPFAQIFLDSVEVESDLLKAHINIVKNKMILFDSIEVIGKANISKTFLKNYLGIKQGNLYNEKLIKNANQRLYELAYIKVLKSPAVYFYGNKARPLLYIDNKKASSADGIIGIAPNSSQNNKLVLTGDFNLKLQNILGSGKSFDLTYRSFLGNSQDLNLKFNYPYFLGTKLGLDYGLKILKYDTAFVNVQNDFALQYRFIGNDYVKVYYSIQQSTLLSVDTLNIKNIRQLPSVNDIRSDFYGIAVRKSKLDYFINPKKGFAFDIDFAAGTKNIIRNNIINTLKVSDNKGNAYNLYDSIKLNVFQIRCIANVEKYFHLFSNNVLKTSINSGYLQSSNIFFNELFRIGGLKTLRGFDEQSIFASQYGILNVEWRYLVQQNSNFVLFWNGAWYKNEGRKPAISDTPWGAGLGLNIETGSGIFSLYYATGKQFDNPLEFRTAKIHFGFINYF
jgi:outer membrane protein assembly factor BamA